MKKVMALIIVVLLLIVLWYAFGFVYLTTYTNNVPPIPPNIDAMSNIGDNQYGYNFGNDEDMHRIASKSTDIYLEAIKFTFPDNKLEPQYGAVQKNNDILRVMGYIDYYINNEKIGESKTNISSIVDKNVSRYEKLLENIPRHTEVFNVESPEIEDDKTMTRLQFFVLINEIFFENYEFNYDLPEEEVVTVCDSFSDGDNIPKGCDRAIGVLCNANIVLGGKGELLLDNYVKTEDLSIVMRRVVYYHIHSFEYGIQNFKKVNYFLNEYLGKPLIPIMASITFCFFGLCVDWIRTKFKMTVKSNEKK